MYLFLGRLGRILRVAYKCDYSPSLEVDSEEELKKYFTGLSDGGEITMPVEKQFWGAVYGSLIDKYGVNWGFNYPTGE